MAEKVLVLLGTKKGAFILESDALRRSWDLRGPFCETWPMHHVVADSATGTIYAGGGDSWFGAAVWKTTDLGESWTHSSEGLAYPAGEDPIKAVDQLRERRQFDEIILSTLPQPISKWLGMDLPHRLHRHTGLPVTTITAKRVV